MSKELQIQFAESRPRIMSAKPTTSIKRRPFSGVSTQTFSRKQLIQNVYTTFSKPKSQRVDSAKALTTRMIVVESDLQKSKKIVVKQSKKKQELQNQILLLKKTINRLVEQLAQQRGKTQNVRKKNQQYSKTLAVQFQNESYWNSNALNTHMVAGIKNMYDVMKGKYQQILVEVDTLQKRQDLNREQEQSAYIQALEQEIRTLNAKYQRNSFANVETLVSNLPKKLAKGYIQSQIEEDYDKLIEKLKKLKAKLTMTKENLEDRNKKIAFLEKIIIEKDNHIHSLEREIKKIRNESDIASSKFKSASFQLKELQQKYLQEVADLSHLIKSREESFQAEKATILSANKTKIDKLQKETQYYQQVVKGLRSTNSDLNKEVQEIKLAKNIKITTFAQQKLDQPYNSNVSSKNHIEFITQHQKTVSNYASHNSGYEGLISDGKRVPQKADKKYHQTSQKKRKVCLEQIQQITELLRLKVINASLSIDGVKALFDYKTSDSLHKNKEWESIFITLKQTKSILLNTPFNLLENQAEILARYLIEDVQAQYVYCDDYNENDRSIVKSIVKNILGDYPIYSENTDLIEQFEFIISNYGKNLQTNLQAIEPAGLISKKRFLQTLTSLGVESSEEVRQILLSKMSSKATSISKLKFGAIFD